MALFESCVLSIAVVVCSITQSVVSQGMIVPFDDANRETIVQAHNDLRSEVSPSAANMLMMASTALSICSLYYCVSSSVLLIISRTACIMEVIVLHTPDKQLLSTRIIMIS